MTAREWELALPSELSNAARIDIARAFAQALVDRYGVAADVAIHARHRDAWAEAREEGQGHVSAGLAALRAAAGRQAKELDQEEVRQRLARIVGRELGEEHDHKPGQGSRDIRGRLADVLGKARGEDQEREKARQKEREQELDEERKRQRERDRDLGWEL